MDNQLRVANELNEMTIVDRENRYLGVEDDLFTLSQIDNKKEWTFPYPTLCNGSKDNEETIMKTTDIDTFKEILYELAPVLKFVNWNNILLAGGSVSSILIGREINDLDLFVYGIDEKDATKKVYDLIETLDKELNKMINKNEIDKIDADFMMKTKNMSNEQKNYEKQFLSYPKRSKQPVVKCAKQNHVITLTFDRRVRKNYPKIQIIFRLYNTVSEILHGFDISASGVGFNGNDVYFTSLSKFAYEYRCNIVDVTRRSPTYEDRLMKYFARGFNIVFPDMDINKISKRFIENYENVAEICGLPNMCFSYNKVYGNMIRIVAFHKKKLYSNDSDYDYTKSDEFDCSEHTINLHNIKMINSSENEETNLIVYGNLNNIKNPQISTYRMERTYMDLRKQLIAGSVFNKYSVKKNIKITDCDTVYHSLGDEAAIDTIINLELTRINDRVKSTNLAISWNVENRMKQLLTSSFKPIETSVAEWYGDYLLLV